MLTGIIPQAVQKTKKYGFVRRASKRRLIGDVLYMKGADGAETCALEGRAIQSFGREP